MLVDNGAMYEPETESGNEGERALGRSDQAVVEWRVGATRAWKAGERR